MKTLFLIGLALVGVVVLGFTLQWLRWEVIPTLKDKKNK